MSISKDNLNVLADFARIVEEYCTVIESLKDGRPPQLYEKLETLLADLTVAILPVEKGMPKKKHPEFEKLRISYDQWEEIAGRISRVVADEASELVVRHEDVDADDEHCITQCATLWDDLADIYRDLKDGLTLWGIATNDARAAAAWQWRFGYEHHWGNHLFRAMATIHEARYQLNAD